MIQLYLTRGSRLMLSIDDHNNLTNYTFVNRLLVWTMLAFEVANVKGDFLYENVERYITDSIADSLTSIFTVSDSGA